MKRNRQIILIILGLIAMAWLYWSINMQKNTKSQERSVTTSNNSEKK